MASNKDVAIAFTKGCKLQGSNMHSEGDVVYSYGEHWPIAARVNGKVFLNTDKTSMTTSCHTSLVERELDTYTEVSHSEIQKIVHSDASQPVVIERLCLPKNERQMFDCLYYYMAETCNVDKRKANAYCKKTLTDMKHLQVLSGV